MHAQIERSLITTYRKNIYARFIKAIKEYKLIDENDYLLLILDGGKRSFLCAKLLQELNNHSSLSFNIDYVFFDKGLEEKIKEAGIEAIEITHPIDYSKYNKVVSGECYDDVIIKTLESILLEGRFATFLPKEMKNNIIIRPLYLIREIDINRWRNYNVLSFNDDDINDNKKTKELLKHLRKEYNAQVEDNIFIAANNVNLDKLMGYVKNGEFIFYLENYDKR